MARHFTLLKDHLPLIVAALHPLLQPLPAAVAGDCSLPEIRLPAVKCIDMLGHHMNVYMTGEGATLVDDLNAGYAFWEAIVPLLVDVLQCDRNALPMRSAACEALSNIGVYTYERMPVSVT